MKTKKTVSKRQLQKYIDELIALAKTATADVESVIHVPGYDGQHAWIEIYVPDELEEQIGDLVSEHAHKIFMKDGYDIGAIVYEKSDLLQTSDEYNGRQ
jgi:hypothetical protein